MIVLQLDFTPCTGELGIMGQADLLVAAQFSLIRVVRATAVQRVPSLGLLRSSVALLVSLLLVFSRDDFIVSNQLSLACFIVDILTGIFTKIL